MPPFDSLNLAMHVGDNPNHVALNRQSLAQLLPAKPCWLRQTHSNNIAFLDDDVDLSQPFDASITTKVNTVCAVMTGDCLPVLICNTQGSVVGAVHAGWQGLATGIIGKCVTAMIKRYQLDPQDMLVWLGPAISQRHFEIGDDVKCKLQEGMPKGVKAHKPFIKATLPGKWFADVYHIARVQLLAVGVTLVYGGDYCTYAQASRFFSYRRASHQSMAGQPVSTGRMVSVVSLKSDKN